jgi:hypothetical protein
MHLIYIFMPAAIKINVIINITEMLNVTDMLRII